MKCEECDFEMRSFYFNLYGKNICYVCSSELMNDLEDFKIKLNDKEIKKCQEKMKKQ